MPMAGAPATTAGDIEQVVAYAVSKRCTDAALIYPLVLEKTLDTCVGGRVNVRSLTFGLDTELDKAGQTLLQALLPTPDLVVQA